MGLNAKNIKFDNGATVDSLIKGMVKILDQAKISPISAMSAKIVSSFVENTICTLAAVERFATISDTFLIEDNIVKNIDGYNMHRQVELNMTYDFNVVNNSGSPAAFYLNFIPRYYVNNNFNAPTNWNTHIHQMSVEAPTGTRRFIMPVHDVFAFGESTCGLDFMLYPASLPENVRITTTSNNTISLKTYSSQYQ